MKTVKLFRYTIQSNRTGEISQSKWTSWSFIELAGRTIVHYQLLKIEEKEEDYE